MAIELRIQSGARAGQHETFQQPVVAIGRHPRSDLRFDPAYDLDVSTRHAELRASGATYAIHDTGSRNGTFVNGERVGAEGRVLADGDVVTFGTGGPAAIVRYRTARDTGERIAIAVEAQTRSLKRVVAAVVVVLGGVAGMALWSAHRDADARAREIRSLTTQYESTSKAFQTRLQGMNDTALTNDLQRRNDSLTSAVRGAQTVDAALAAQQALRESHQVLESAAQMDLPAVRDANDPAVVLIYTELGSQAYESTGFDVTPTGLIVTNRHVVRDSAHTATTIAVKFANTSTWHRAHVVQISDDPAVDLAAIQADDGGPFPTVRGVAGSVDAPVGGSIATLGFPLGTEMPMEGSGADLVAKTSLTIGTISKTTDDVLQINAFATHGSSGSPVFDAHGHVIGVIYGGPSGAAGQIVYAVPAQRVISLLRGVR